MICGQMSRKKGQDKLVNTRNIWQPNNCVLSHFSSYVLILLHWHSNMSALLPSSGSKKHIIKHGHNWGSLLQASADETVSLNQINVHHSKNFRR